MNLVSPNETRPSLVSLSGGRAAPESGGELAEWVARVQALQPRLVDAWEATALVESLGYTDRLVQQEFGFTDTRAAGDYVFGLTDGPGSVKDSWAPPKTDSPLAIIVRSAASSLIYAVPWLTVFVVQTMRPDAMRLPSVIAPALSLALMFSLVASGGLVQAIVRRGEFYVGLRQTGLARQVAIRLLCIGVAILLGVDVVAVFIGWYFKLFTWPALVLGADAFMIMSVLWMVCGVFTIRQQQWRVAVAFAVGFIVFAATRAAGYDVVTSQLFAAAAVLIVAALEASRLFRDGDGSPRVVPMPRLSVLVYWTVPYFWYGTVYFAFLFADRLTAGTALALRSDAPFAVPAQYNLGMEMALLTLLVAASGVEVAGALFARAFIRAGVCPLSAGPQLLLSVAGRHHLRALTLTITAFAVAAACIALLVRRALPELMTSYAWSTLFAGDVGYACLTVGLLNSLVLFQTRQAWTVVQEFTAALVINLTVGYVLSHALGSFHAVDGLLLGAGYFAVASTLAVRRRLKHPDYAYAVG